MRRAGLAAVATVLTIAWLGGCSIHRAPAGDTGRSALAPALKSAGSATVPAGGGAGSGSTAWSTVKAGTYVVRTIWQNAPLSGARVEWRRHVYDAAPALSGITERIGTAIFRPATGAYYLTAEWRQDGDYARPRKPGDRFAYFGGNPWLVSSENSEVITLLLEEVPPPPPQSPPQTGTGVYGRVTLEGAPVAGAGVFAYAKTGTGLKADDFQATVRTNAKGEFALELPPDRYYLVARLRADNSVKR